MKKTEKKLKLKKFQIAKLNKLNSVVGGNGTNDGNTGTHTNTNTGTTQATITGTTG